ncbi:hypothetical protein K7459_30150, partial [Pseudomonas fluorescens]|uniref:hypothetical protein n=1 Tax=Pseudomonas fluorescens TaxID=294 RepID=UPI001CA68D44
MRTLTQALNALIVVVEETLTKPARYQSIARDPAFPGAGSRDPQGRRATGRPGPLHARRDGRH